MCESMTISWPILVYLKQLAISCSLILSIVLKQLYIFSILLSIRQRQFQKCFVINRAHWKKGSINTFLHIHTYLDAERHFDPTFGLPIIKYLLIINATAWNSTFDITIQLATQCSPRWSEMHDDIIMVWVLKFPPTIFRDGIWP